MHGWVITKFGEPPWVGLTYIISHADDMTNHEDGYIKKRNESWQTCRETLNPYALLVGM